MIGREGEPTGFLEVPYISLKTSSEQLKIWAKERWRSDARKRVASDIVNNGKELLAGINIDWELVLSSIRTEQLGTVYYGEPAIARRDGFHIGALAASCDWAMHDPQIVYLSGKLLVDRTKSGNKLEDFKERMLERVVNYGQSLLPHADFYTEALEFLLDKNRREHKDVINRLTTLLGKGDIEEAHRFVKKHG